MPVRPLLFMRKRSVLGPIIGKHYGFNKLSKSTGSFHDPVIGSTVAKAVSGWTGLESCA